MLKPIHGQFLLRTIGDLPTRQDVALLLGGFDSAGPDMPYGANSLAGFHAQLDQKSRGDRPCAAETATTMEENATTGSNNLAQIGAVDGPSVFEALIGHGNIDDR